MSMDCYVCDQRIGPTSSLPGRHAGYMYLTLPVSTYYLEDGKVKSSINLRMLNAQMPICLECVERGVKENLPNDREALIRLEDLYEYSQGNFLYSLQLREKYSKSEESSEVHWQKLKQHDEDVKSCMICRCNTEAIPGAQFVEFDRFQCREFEKGKIPFYLRHGFGLKNITEMSDEEERNSFFGPIYHITRHNPEYGKLFSLCMGCFARILPEAFHLYGWWVSDNKGDKPNLLLKQEERSNAPKLTLQTEVYQDLKKQLGVEGAEELLIDYDVQVKDISKILGE